jgi:Rieske [2Fe-2S] domain
MALIWISNTAKAFRNNDRFYAVRKTEHSVTIVDATCAHRGGPLIYATVSSTSTDTLLCPWHQRKIFKKELCNRLIPAIRIGNNVLVVLVKTKFKLLTHGVTDL